MKFSNKVLVVDDSVSIRNLIAAQFEAKSELELVLVSNYAETEKFLQQESELLCAVLDLNLPDASNGEIVDLVQSYSIPAIILTGAINSAITMTMKSERVLDYIVKRNPSDIKYLVTTIQKLYDNQSVKVMVVDDSITFRQYICGLLENLRYTVLEATDGVQALTVIEEHPDISLVITDYNMPNMDGLTLIEEIRKNYKREQMAVLGLSSQNDSDLIVKLLKTGANDYMNKPFIVNEFYCRVQQNTSMIGYVRAVNESATSDYLTKVSNRRSLYDMGELMYANAARQSVKIAVAMIDADHFKRINDTYGHDVGDQVLINIAKVLKSGLRSGDIVGRYGGEEFVCVTVIKNLEDGRMVFERIRKKIQEIDISIDGNKLDVSVSIGMTTNLATSFNEMIKLADKGLYEAKEGGRNQVVEVP